MIRLNARYKEKKSHLFNKVSNNLCGVNLFISLNLTLSRITKRGLKTTTKGLLLRRLIFDVQVVFWVDIQMDKGSIHGLKFLDMQS